jgi:protocatechuate 3,4-dioxygenase beta subunit
MDHAEEHDHDRGLAFDLATLSRRRTLALLGGGALAVLVGCGSDDGDDAAASTTTTSTTAGDTSTTAAAAGECSTIPEETAGPFPGDGSNGPDVLTADGIVRSDIRSSFGSSTTTAEGVPLAIDLQLTDSTGGCSALAGAAVYVWHCDREGGYSLYSEGIEGENYLRGVQEAGGDGRVRFDSIFPAAYPGRWPHVHFEVYESLEAATGGGTRIATSQVALPEDACNAVYATSGYEASVRTMTQTSLTSDGVFGDDGGTSQLGTVTGSVEDGYTVALAVAVDPTNVSSGASGPGSDGAPPGA